MRVERDELRKNSKIFLGIYDQVDDGLIGYLIDLTTKGMRLKGKIEIEDGTEFKIRMDLPFELNDSNLISFKIRSKWCNKLDDSKYYETGFEILECSKNDTLKIKALLKTDSFSINQDKYHISLSMVDA